MFLINADYHQRFDSTSVARGLRYKKYGGECKKGVMAGVTIRPPLAAIKSEQRFWT